MAERYCEWRMLDGELCGRPTDSSDHGLCPMHRQRMHRGAPMGAPPKLRLTPFGRVTEAAIALADADAEDDTAWRHAVGRLASAAEAWLAERGWARPPGNQKGLHEMDTPGSAPLSGEHPVDATENTPITGGHSI
jgi:hypothetical protein